MGASSGQRRWGSQIKKVEPTRSYLPAPGVFNYLQVSGGVECSGRGVVGVAESAKSQRVEMAMVIPHTHTHNIKITLSDQSYILAGIDLLSYLYPYPCGYGSPNGSPVPTKAKHLSKYYMIQMSSISI
jgi:hypothetical protein